MTDESKPVPECPACSPDALRLANETYARMLMGSKLVEVSRVTGRSISEWRDGVRVVEVRTDAAGRPTALLVRLP